MNRKKLMLVALACVLGTGLAQARDGADVQWSVTIGGPIGGLVGGLVYSQPYPVYRQPYPVYMQPSPAYSRHVGRQVTHWDRDGDGIPNRFDRVYNPRWDRDGDGISKHHDRHDRHVRHDSHDRHDGRGADRDGDGIPNWQDRYDGRPGWGR